MHALRTIAVACMLAVTAVAQDLPQRFSGTTPNPVQAEGDLTIEYANVNRAGTTITIEVHDGADPLDTVEIEITLCVICGTGTHVFEVPPGWGSVVLTYPDSADYTVPVTDQ